MTKTEIKITKIKGKTIEKCVDEVALERAFAIRVSGGESFCVSCTPELLEELALGQLLSRGLISSIEQVRKIEICEDTGEILVDLSPGKKDIPMEESPRAEGFESQEELFFLASGFFDRPGKLFADTGCAHSCAVFAGGRLRCQAEDIGRHNALDKALGMALKEGIDLSGAAVFTSGRISGDYMKKVISSGIRTVVSRAAVTDEAVRLGRTHRIAIYGFVRGERGNLYAPPWE